MQKSLIAIFAFLILNISSSAQTIIFTGNGGDDNWETPANWNLNRVPNANDDVIFASNQIVLLNTNTEIRSLAVELTHLLEIKANLTIKGGHSQTEIGLRNRGVVFIDNGGTLFIEDIDETGILNENNITVAEGGSIRFVSNTGFSFYDNAAIENLGEIINSGDITLSQDFDDPSEDNVNPEKALINSGIIRNFDFISLDDIVINQAGGEIFNSGSFSVNVQIFAFEADEMINEGAITNQDGGTLDVNQLQNDGQITTEANSTLRGDFLLNQKKITNAGTIHFTQIFLKKDLTLLLNSSTGTLEVEGDFVVENGAIVNNQNICNIKPNPNVSFDEGDGLSLDGKWLNIGTTNFDVGTLNIGLSGNMSNTGTLNFGTNNPFFSNIINLGLLENQAGGTMNIDVITAGNGQVDERPYWLHNLPTATFRNAGDVLCVNRDNDENTFPDTVIVNLGTMENQLGGNIQLHHTAGISVGIFNQNNFTNLGNITVGKANEVAAIGVVNKGIFRNESPGDLIIDNTTLNAILNVENATFQNVAGDIFIGQSVGVQQFAIVNEGRWESELIGGLTPFIIVETCSDDAIVNEPNAEFFNRGDLRIGVNGAAGRGGIFNKGTFHNLDRGNIRIENYGVNFTQPINGGISNNGAFFNTAKIDIKEAQNDYTALLNRENATFTNNRCGQFESPEVIDNKGTITNNGFWESTHNGFAHSNEGDFVNNGLVEDHFDSFDALGSFGVENELENNGIIANRGIAEENDLEILEIFHFGNEVPINFSFGDDLGDEVFDINNQDIGRFNIADNIELDNPLPQGEHELHFKARDADQFCSVEITLFIDIEPDFSCDLTVTNATNGNNNGAIMTQIQGGTAPFTFAWTTPDGSEPMAQNLSNLAPGSYILTITDDVERMTTCEAFVNMDSESPECNGITIHWDGGASHDANGAVITNDNNEVIFGGDGISWSDPLNWRGDRVPNASDAVGGFFEFYTLPENRKRINLDIDAAVESFSSTGVGGVFVNLMIPAGKKLTVACSFRDGLFENAGELEVTAGTAEFGNFDFVNEGTIKVTGIGSDDVLLQINSGGTTLTNNGVIEVNNLAKNGILLNAVELINNGELILKNGSVAFSNNIINKSDGTISISNAARGITAGGENEGEIIIKKVDIGIINSFENKEDGRITIDSADVCIEIPFQKVFSNEGEIKLGSSTEGEQGIFKTGIFNEGTFTNENILTIDGFTEAGILNEGDFQQLPANQELAIFINEIAGVIELNGHIDSKGRPLPNIGISNKEGAFQNRNDLFIKDIKTVGIRNIGHHPGFSNMEGDFFRNEGVITLNFIGVNHNKPAAIGIHNTLDGQFINDHEVLIGTIKDNFTIGGKIKGVGIYCEPFHGLGGRDSSLFINNKLIKIDNIISGGPLNGLSTGHGLLTHQRASRHPEVDSFFINKGPNPFGTGLLQIGTHKRVAGSGIRIQHGVAGIRGRIVNDNGGTIRVNQTGSHGVHLQGIGNDIAEFDNAGLLNIGDQITIEDNGIKIVNSEFHNEENGVVNINATLGNGIEIISDTDQNVILDALFRNESEVNIGNAAGIDKSGIILKLAENGNSNQRAEFRNLDNSTLNIDRCDRSGIEIMGRQLVDDGHLEFENHSTLNIGQNTPDNQLFAENGIDIVAGNFSMFTPDEGATILLIDRVQKHGIQIEKGDANLKGTVDIGTNQVVGLDGFHLVNASSRIFSSAIVNIKNTGHNGVDITDGFMSVGNVFRIDGVAENGIVINNGDVRNAAQMNIDNLDGNAIELFGSEGRFDNNNFLKIGEVPVGGCGIIIDDGANFNNREQVEIVGTLGCGIFNDGTFDNFSATSMLLIDNADTAVINHNFFRNANKEGQIIIEDFKVGIINNRIGSPFANISNSGLIKMQNSPLASSEDLCLQNINGGFMTNNGCAKIELFGNFENKNSTLRNFGFITFEAINNPTLITNQGTFDNEGVIEDVQQRFNVASITTNSDVILHPICVGDPNSGILQNAVILGDNVSFSIGSWSVNSFGNGIYDQNTNETIFDSPFPNQVVVAEFTIVDDLRSCTLEAQESIDFRDLQDAVIADAGDDQSMICDNKTQLNARPAPVSVTGIWTILQGDGQGIIDVPTDPLTNFYGIAGQSYTLRWTLTADCGSGTDDVVITFEADADNDTVCDAEDICPNGDDRIDNNVNGIPDACEGNNTPCSENELTLNNNPILAGTYHAVQTLTSKGTITNNTNVIFKAGMAITLQTDFHAVAGSNFSAVIEACPAALVSREVIINHHDFENHGDLNKQPMVKAFPNPLQYATNLEITLSNPTEVQLDLYDLNGRKVANLVAPTLLTTGQHLYKWECEAVEAGMYLLVMNGQEVGKLVIVK